MSKLSPIQRLLVRRRIAAAQGEPSAEGELDIVPFLDITVNLVIVLLVIIASALSVSRVDAQLPEYGPPGQGGALDLHVTLAEGGAIVSASGGTLAPGCEETVRSEPVVTVPRRGGAWQWDALTRCAARIKDEHPDSSQVTLSADPTVPYEQVVAAMDALRNDGATPLFPEVLISAGVR